MNDEEKLEQIAVAGLMSHAAIEVGSQFTPATGLEGPTVARDLIVKCAGILVGSVIHEGSLTRDEVIRRVVDEADESNRKVNEIKARQKAEQN